MATDKVKVAVRVRPINRRETELGTKIVVDMDPQQTFLLPLKSRHDSGGRKHPKTFAFDHCFWSMDENNPKYASQEHVFNLLGKDILEQAYNGYNGCIFAYGQTGSGKSYTMMGTMEQKGIIPRLCDALFEHIASITDPELTFKVEVSYMEIYNEKVHDLLDYKGGKSNLRVREHNILGPYVDGLSMLAVASFEDIEKLMSEGNKSRTVAATNMNNESSRSHAVFNIIITQTLVDRASGIAGEKVSKLSLVDLAGSERAQKTGAVGERLKEGSNINKSLTTLGLVISALADQAAGKNKNKFVPYRDSVLTWLLKDNLGGNSKTVMVATISPAADNYEETLSTLRYADRAKRIVNHAVVNEDPNARIIRELREEVEVLRQQLSEAQSMKPVGEVRERLEESEKLMKEMTKTWEEKLQETERIHQERHKALEQMGISVQTSGIKVEQGKVFLVNLNSDPSLNELLVYYLKEHTLVGRPDAPVQQDIQLQGLGIMPEHCVVDIEANEVFLTPRENARTCVNGSAVHQRTKVKHGDRILWGNNHFFRLNCPKTSSPLTAEPDQTIIDYDYAQQELMMKELSNDPIQEAISAIEKQHEEDKQEALEKQRQMYERQMQMLRSQLMSPGTPSFPLQMFEMSRLTPTGGNAASPQNTIQRKYQQWASEREKVFKQSLAKLREELVKANTLVREASFLSQEMGKQTEFHVTLQIPAQNLSPNRRRGAFVSEPAILVKRRGRPSQVWSMEKLENKIIDMRDMYEDRKAQGGPMMVLDTSEADVSEADVSVTDEGVSSQSPSSSLSRLRPVTEHPLMPDASAGWDQGPPVKGDPFYESQENHKLIGVANIFLECLFSNVKLDYHVPIISQQGEAAGKLHIEISKVGSAILDRYVDCSNEDEPSVPMGAPVLIRVCIKEARGLPPALCNFVFCQYTFWGEMEHIVVPPEINPEAIAKSNDNTVSFIFNHEKDFRVPITEEFIEHCSEGALSIEVWGHSSHGFTPGGQIPDSIQATRTLKDRWNEVMRRVELWVEIHELNDQGEYSPVEVSPKPEVPCAGVFQLRQGHSRRIMARVKTLPNTGLLPLICESLTSISIGCICARSKLQKGLDSYQEEDLSLLRERWSEALRRRKEYLDHQIQGLIHKPDKTEADSERERALIEQWISLTEERNAVMAPEPGGNIPGAPADWDPPPDIEEHSPVLFLDLNADDMSTTSAKEGLQAAGINSILPKEHSSSFINLPITRSFTEKENVCAIASWDSSIHDSPHLNRVTPTNERVYLILKAVVRLSHPVSMELVLRKRICINIYKKQSLSSLTHMLKNRIIGSEYLKASGINYTVVSNIPKGSEDLEDMETLAQMAASPNVVDAADGETYIEKYIRGVSAVESILTIDRLRQEVAVKELMAISGQSNLRKTTSVPNMNQILASPPGIGEQMRADSIGDLSLSPTSQFYPVTPKLVMSPLTAKLGVKPMKTLVEEQHQRERKPLLHQDTEDDMDDDDAVGHGSSSTTGKTNKPAAAAATVVEAVGSADSDDFQDFESYQSQQMRQGGGETAITTMTHSSTNDSLAEAPHKGYTPSMTSSGYGSQAVSTLTLSSEDSLSMKSIEEHSDRASKAVNKLSSTETSGDSDLEDNSREDNKTQDHPSGGSKAEDKDGDANMSAESDVEDGGAEKTKAADQEDKDREELVSQRQMARSDSLLDENVPELIDAPLDPVATTAGDLNTSNDDSSTTLTDSGSDGQTRIPTGGGGGGGGGMGNLAENFARLDSAGPNSGETGSSQGEADPYSVTALEELERFQGDEGDTDSLDKGAFDDMCDDQASSSKPQRDADTTTATPPPEGSDSTTTTTTTTTTTATSPRNKTATPPPKGPEAEAKQSAGAGDRTVSTPNTLALSSSENIPSAVSGSGSGSSSQRAEDKGVVVLRRKGSGNDRPRPLSSCVMSPHSESLARAQQLQGELNRRSSLHVSQDQLTGLDESLSECSFGSRADLDRLLDAPVPSWVQEGEPVTVTTSRGSKPGVVRFLGSVEFAAGNWVGVELDQPEGKNDGSVHNMRYFKCRPRHGVFVRPDKLIWDKKRKNSRKSSAAANRRSLGLAATSPLSNSASNIASSGNSSSSTYMKATSASSAKRK